MVSIFIWILWQILNNIKLTIYVLGTQFFEYIIFGLWLSRIPSSNSSINQIKISIFYNQKLLTFVCLFTFLRINNFLDINAHDKQHVFCFTYKSKVHLNIVYMIVWFYIDWFQNLHRELVAQSLHSTLSPNHHYPFYDDADL